MLGGKLGSDLTQIRHRVDRRVSNADRNPVDAALWNSPATDIRNGDLEITAQQQLVKDGLAVLCTQRPVRRNVAAASSVHELRR
jgi:hypothetical protein